MGPVPWAIGGLLALTLSAPGEEAGPAGGLAEIRSRHESALAEYNRALREAQGDEQRRAAIDRYLAAVKQNAGDALDLAAGRPGDPANIKALGFVIVIARGGPGDESTRAIEILARDHAGHPGIAQVCGNLFIFFHLPAAEALIRAVAEGHPDRAERGLARLALADYQAQQARLIRLFRSEAGAAQREGYERSYSPEVMAAFLANDPDALDREADAGLERVVAEFGDVRFRDASPAGHHPADDRTLGEVADGMLFARRHLAVGKVAPEIEGDDHEGRPFKLSDSRGKVVVLTFSGNWCGPCVAMYPQERALLERHADDPFALVSVNTDEDVATLREAIDAGEITWRCWFDGGTDGPITTRWGVQAFPTIYVLDPAGVIRHVNLRGDALDEAVAALLDEARGAQAP